MIRTIAIMGFITLGAYCGPDLVVESSNAIVLPIWIFGGLHELLQEQTGENWFSRGSAFWGYGLWFFNVMVHFLMLVLLNKFLGDFLARSVAHYKGSAIQTFGQGLLYLVGIPMLIVYSLATMLGFPFGLLLLAFYLLSIWLGDCLAALLICHLLNTRNEPSWNYWTIVMLSLGIVIIIDLLIFIPVLGILIYIGILAYTYGVLFNLVNRAYPNLNPLKI